VLALGAIALSLLAAGLGTTNWVNVNGFPLFWRFWVAILHPDVSVEFLRVVGNATLVTLAYAVCGTCLSVAIGLVGGLLASEVWWSSCFLHRIAQIRPIWLGIRAGLAIPRAIHEMIWGLFFLNIVGLDPLVGILAIAIPYGAIVAKVFSELLDETPRQPLQALLNSGVSVWNAMLYGLLPQAFLNLLSYTFYRFECSIRSAAVLGMIGAGGLGYEVFLSLQSLRYEQLWTLFAALFLLNGTVDMSSAILRRRLGSPSRLDLNFHRGRQLTPTPHSQPRRPQRDPVVWLFGLGFSALIPFCFWFVKPDFTKLWAERTATLLHSIGQDAFPPQWSAELLNTLLPLSLQTVAMSILAIALAGFGGMLLAFPAAANFFLPGGLLNPMTHQPWGRLTTWCGLLLTRSLLLLERAIPAPIWALVCVFVFFPGMVPGAIALGLHNMGILGRLMAEVIENLDSRPLVALKAQGTPAILVFLYGVLPLTFTRFIAYILYRWEVCMRETVIVGLVGAGGLGRLLSEQLSSFAYDQVVVTLGCFVCLTFGVDWISQAARRSLR
jgi:phosphonate transport system permease protein